MPELVDRRQLLLLAQGLLAGCATVPARTPPPSQDVLAQRLVLEDAMGVARLRAATGLRGRVTVTVFGAMRLDARFWLSPHVRHFELHDKAGRRLQLVDGDVRLDPPSAMPVDLAAHELHCWRELLFLAFLLHEPRWRLRALVPELVGGKWCQGLQLGLPTDHARSLDWFELWHAGKWMKLRYRSGFGRPSSANRELVARQWSSIEGIAVPHDITLRQEEEEVGSVVLRDVLCSPRI